MGACVCVPIGGRLEYVFMLLCSKEKHSEDKVQELEQAAFDSAELESDGVCWEAVGFAFLRQERAKTSSTSEEVSRLTAFLEAGSLSMCCMWVPQTVLCS